MDKFRKIIKDSGILADVKTTSEGAGLMSVLFKEVIEMLLLAEQEEHLAYKKSARNDSDNARNGYTSKKLKSKFGLLDIQVPRDRKGTFEPEILPKRVNKSPDLEDMVISLYSKGMSNTDIENFMAEKMKVNLSRSSISRITEKVRDEITAWQNRPLASVYSIVYLDAVHFSSREHISSSKVAVNLVMGIDTEGQKDVLGIWITNNESASFWQEVLTDLQMRGVEDILLTVSDNLPGFTRAIQAVFPESNRQICVVHQLRNSLRRVSYKDKKSVVDTMKPIYNALNEKEALKKLWKLKEK